LLDEEARGDIEILAGSVDGPEEQQMMIDRVRDNYDVQVDYTLLTDEGHRVIDRYGVLNPDDERGIPHPTTIVVDRDGVMRWLVTETNYRMRPENETILEQLEAVR